MLGTYVFKVMGADNDGLWNSTSAMLCIVIRPPFCSTWWFQQLRGLAAWKRMIYFSINRYNPQEEL
jgi:hypothetical protein